MENPQHAHTPDAPPRRETARGGPLSPRALVKAAPDWYNIFIKLRTRRAAGVHTRRWM